jgi:sugar lactone lactonase YvrE
MLSFLRLVLVALLTLIFTVSPICGRISLTSAAQDIFIADPGSGAVRRYTAAGVDLGDFVSGLSSPSWITTDRSGNVYVSEHEGQKVTKFSPTTLPLTIETPYNPGGVLVGPDGTIYVADYFGAGIYHYSASGADLGLFATTSLVRADFLAFDVGGNLLVTDPVLGVIRPISPAGLELDDVVVGFSGLAGIAFGPDGNLYVASFTDNWIYKYSLSDGSVSGFAYVGPNASIFGIAFDTSGNLYVANYAERNVHKFSPAGADLGVFASTGLVQPRAVTIPTTAAPTVKEECKNDGWQAFAFNNQGDCVQLLNTGK